MPPKKHRITVESSVSIEAQYKYISLKNTCPQYFSPDKVQVIDKSNESYKNEMILSVYVYTVLLSGLLWVLSIWDHCKTGRQVATTFC